VLALPEDTALMLLAPVVRERKGEQQGICSTSCARRALCRARAGGRRGVHELDAVPPLALRRSTRSRRWSTASRCAPDIKQRLAESFETALRLRRRLVIAQSMDGAGRETAVLGQVRLPGLRLRLPELEPRLFSFNNPMGACPGCDGLGVTAVLRSRRAWWHHPDLSPGRRRDPRLGPAQRLLLPDAAKPGAKHYGFDVDTALGASARRDPPCRSCCTAAAGRSIRSST
jgi:excinuclease ABC subunit A